MPAFLQTVSYVGGIRGFNRWTTFEEDLDQLKALRDRVTRERQDLPESTWELLVALRSYVHKKLPHDGWKHPDRHDAFHMLDQAEAGASYRCVEHGILLCQVYQAFGIPARTLALEQGVPNLGYGQGHVLCEAWLDEASQWVVMDSQLDAHWEHRGRPLSGLEVHNLVLEGRFADLDWVFGHAESVTAGKKQTWARYFTGLKPGRDMGWLSRPVREKGRAGLRYMDPRVAPQFEFQGFAQPLIPEAEPAAIWFDCNRVNIQVMAVKWLEDGKAQLTLQVEHCTPWFARFETEVTAGEFAWTGPNTATWSFGMGDPELSVWTVNAMGRKGKPSCLGFLYTDPEMLQKQ